MRVAFAENWRIEVKFAMTASKPLVTPNQFAIYQVKVQGKLDQNWMQSFQGITADFDGEVTTLNDIVADQSALRGLLCCLWDFNLTLLSVVRIHPDENLSEIGCQ